MKDKWIEAPQSLIDMAKELIRAHRRDLRDARIGFLLRTEPSYSHGKTVSGKAEKVSEKHKLLLDLDFLIWIDEETWNTLIDDQRRALIFHQLCHCIYYPDKDLASIVGHDVEEFSEVVALFGPWNSTLYRFDRALFEKGSERVAEQLSMLPPRGAVVAVDPSSVPVEEAY